jgi:hypothetical protein
MSKIDDDRPFTWREWVLIIILVVTIVWVVAA